MTEKEYIREQILLAHSKTNAANIVRWVGNSANRFEVLVQLFLYDEPLIVQRAAWPLSYCAKKHPEYLQKYFKPIIAHMKDDSRHPAVRRNITRILEAINIPKKYHGEIMNECFRYIENPHEKVAVQAFSLTILENLSKTYPEILPELKLIIQERMPHATAAFKSRAKKILKKL